MGEETASREAQRETDRELRRVALSVERLGVLVESIRERISQMENTLHTEVNRIQEALDHELKQRVSRGEFLPVRWIVYGLIGAVGMFVLSAVLTTVLRGR